MDHGLVLPHFESVSLPPVDQHLQTEVTLPSLRSDERIGEILTDSKESKGEDASMRNYKPEDFLMLLPQEGSQGGEFTPPNHYQSACTMCPTCKRVLVYPANSEDDIQCPACKKLVNVGSLAESKLLRTCPQCDTLLGNPTNAPKVLCPLCMKLIDWVPSSKEASLEGDSPKKKRTRKPKEPAQPVIIGTNEDGSPILGPPPKKKKGYVKKGELGYIKPKYSYVKKGQPGYIKPKYSYVKKGQPGYSKPSKLRRSEDEDDDDKEDGDNLGNQKMEDTNDTADVSAAAALLNQAIDAETITESDVV